MKSTKISIYHIQYDKFHLKIEKYLPVIKRLFEENGYSIWEKQGLFRLIPMAALYNLEMQLQTNHKMEALYPQVKPSDMMNYISWDQGISIYPRIARALLSAAKKPSTETDTPTDPASEDQAEQP